MRTGRMHCVAAVVMRSGVTDRAHPAELAMYKVRANTCVAGNTAAYKLAGLDLVTNPDNVFADAGTTGRGATWIQYAIDNTGSLTYAQPASAYEDVETLLDHVF